MPKIILKLGGKPFDPNPPSPTILRISEFLSKSPKDEIYRGEDVCAKAGVAKGYLKSRASIDALSEFTVSVGGRRYFGSQAAIAELKRQTEQR